MPRYYASCNCVVDYETGAIISEHADNITAQREANKLNRQLNKSMNVIIMQIVSFHYAQDNSTPVEAYENGTDALIGTYKSVKECAQKLMLNPQKARHLVRILSGQTKSSFSKVLNKRFYIKAIKTN